MKAMKAPMKAPVMKAMKSMKAMKATKAKKVPAAAIPEDSGLGSWGGLCGLPATGDAARKT